MTGTTLVLDNYIKQAMLANLSVSIMVPDSAYKNIEHSEYGEAVTLYSFKSQENWAVSGFDINLLNSNVFMPKLYILPDLVHIIDWVGFNPALYPFLRSLGCPIVRSVCNFEEFCPLTTPVFYEPNAKPCHPPLAPEQCIDCVSDNHQLTVKGSFTYKVLLRDLVAYRESYRLSILPLLKQRTEFVRSLFNNYIDYVVFPSNNFGQYFLSQLKAQVDFKVIAHGLGEVNVKPMRESVFPIKIIYTGGDRVAKGWDIMAGALEILARVPNHHFEIHCVSNDQGLTEECFRNPNLKVVRSVPYRRDEAERVLGEFDIAIAPSKFESYGLFVRECVKSRVIPIVTSSMGIDEFIVNGENGFHVEEPCAENLANKILELTANPADLTELRANLDFYFVPKASTEFGELYKLYRELTLTC